MGGTLFTLERSGSSGFEVQKSRREDNGGALHEEKHLNKEKAAQDDVGY